MAITKDQVATTNSSASTTTLTVTWGTNPTPGASVLIYVGVHFGSGTTVTATDNGVVQSTFVIDASEQGSAAHWSYILRADNITLPASGSYVVTINCGATGSISAQGVSYLGKAPGGPITTNVGTATSTSVATGAAQAGSGGLLAATFQDSGSGVNTVTLTNGNFTQEGVQTNGSSGQVFACADALESISDSCTWTVTSATWSAAIASYASATSRYDAPVITPGITWLDRFKPWIRKPFQVPPAAQNVGCSGGLALAPIHFSTAITQDASTPAYSGSVGGTNLGSKYSLTYSAAGTIGGTNSNSGSGITTQTHTNSAVGNVLVLGMKITSTSITISSVTGGGATGWVKAAGSSNDGTRSQEFWIGTVNATGAQTATINFSSSNTGITTDFLIQEFSSSLGTNSVWSADTSGFQNNSSASTTITYPTLAPTPKASAELYVGMARVPSGGTYSGLTAGFTGQTDLNNNPFIYGTVSASIGPTQTDTASTASAALGFTLTATSSLVTQTSATFTPPANSLVVVLADVSYSSIESFASVGLTCADSNSISYANPVNQQCGTANGNAIVSNAIFRNYYTTSPGSITVTLSLAIAETVAAGTAINLMVLVLDGCAPNQTGAATASFGSTNTSGLQSATIQPTRVGSRVLMVGGNGNNITSALPGTTTIQSTGADGNNCAVGWAQSTNLTPQGLSPAVYGWNVPSGGVNQIAMLEILPNTQDEGGVSQWDIPSIIPGSTWRDLYKPQWPRPKPFLPAPLVPYLARTTTSTYQTGSASLAITATINNTAGNTLILALKAFSFAWSSGNAVPSITSISDGVNTWQFSPNPGPQNPPTGGCYNSTAGYSAIAAIAYVPAAAAINGTLTVTVAATNSTDLEGEFVVYEFANIPGNTFQGSSSSAAVPTVTPGSFNCNPVNVNTANAVVAINVTSSSNAWQAVTPSYLALDVNFNGSASAAGVAPAPQAGAVVNYSNPSNNEGTILGSAVLAFGTPFLQTSYDQPTVQPGPQWYKFYKPYIPKPVPQLPFGAPPAVVIGSTGSFALAPLAFAAQGAQTSPDQPEIQSGPIWLKFLRPWVNKPVPPTPSQQSVNATGSFSLAPLAFAANGGQTSTDLTQVEPGTTWFDLFKPFWLKSRPQPPAQQSVNGTASFTLAPLAFAAQGSASSPDQTQVQPGPMWLRFLKPWTWKPVPPVPSQQSINATGSFALAPIALAVQGSQTSPDLPSLLPGPIWTRLLRPWINKPVPPLTFGGPPGGIASSGSFALAPLAFAAQGNVTSPDQIQIQPGSVWLRLLKPWAWRSVPPIPSQQSVNGTASFSLAPLAFAANGAQTSTDQTQVEPGTTWFDLFKPTWLRPRPQPPAIQSVNATGSFALAPLAFAAQGSQTGTDVTQTQPGSIWLRLFKPWVQRNVPEPPSQQSVNGTASFSLAPLAFAAQGNVTSPDLTQIQPGTVWQRMLRPWMWRPQPPAPSQQSVNATGNFSLAPLAFSASGAVFTPSSLGDLPVVIPGNFWLRLFKPWIPKPPPFQPAQQSINGTASFALAPLHLSAQGGVTTPDITQIQPGSVWAKIFKPILKPLLPPIPSQQSVNCTGSFTLAPLAFAAQGNSTSYDQPQAQPGNFWTRLFRPWIRKSVPVPPAVQNINGTSSFTLAPLAFQAQGAQTSTDVPQITPGPFWVQLFQWPKRKQPPAYPPPPPTIVSCTGGINLAPIAFQGTMAPLALHINTGIPYSDWQTGNPHTGWQSEGIPGSRWNTGSPTVRWQTGA